ncbi:8351_t:CDS:2, partial [Gigaspora rosea]
MKTFKLAEYRNHNGISSGLGIVEIIAGYIRVNNSDAYEGLTRILDIFDFPQSFKTHHLHEIFKNSKIAVVVTVSTRKAYLDNVTNQLATIKPYESLELRLDMLDIRVSI